MTGYHSKYFANLLTLQKSAEDTDRLSQSIFNAQIDINPHQVEAALFAFKSPLSNGVILADEVGLGKTIEAGLVLCQYWSERKRRLLIIAPASLRKQWSAELKEKFFLDSIIIDGKSFKEELNREARKTEDMQEQSHIQQLIREQERKRRRIQREIFDIEDEIAEERDALIEELKQAMKQRIEENELFILEWEIV